MSRASTVSEKPLELNIFDGFPTPSPVQKPENGSEFNFPDGLQTSHPVDRRFLKNLLELGLASELASRWAPFEEKGIDFALRSLVS